MPKYFNGIISFVLIAQSVVIVIIALGIVLFHSPLAAFAFMYGGGVSIVNNLLIIRISKRQAHIQVSSAQVGFGLLIYSVITRIISVAILIYIGFLVNLSALEMIIGLSIGQITLVIDKLVTKGMNDGSR